ncbi:N-acetylneuraminate synthase [Gracilibacillus kekensis]|uniref:N-acetylneuraminate synthase n=1 Tax=Gracilibacillus kekensis TaxID=1027249 RepID=UPI002452D72B|nr:N-acetylneuraminate synthase [Gracilibacillus kekensis]
MIKIGEKVIHSSSPTYIIAEVGVNHNGDMNIAKKMIDVAVESGADAVKFQTFKAKSLVSSSANLAEYQKKNMGEHESQYNMLKKLELTEQDFIILKEYCEDKGIEFLSTPFDIDSALFLERIGVHAFKVGSGDLTNHPFLKGLANLNIPIILSSGMANLGEIEEALNILKDSEVLLLHCTSDYPAPYEDVNLKVINTMKHSFGNIVGYSDHTDGSEISIGAVALGAKLIEKHFTLDRNMEGPDHKASITPKEFKEMVNSIRNLEKALGDGIKRCMPSEADTKEVARKSIVAKSAITKGTILNEDILTVKRPGNGIEPKFFELIQGKEIKKDVQADQVIKWDDIL